MLHAETLSLHHPDSGKRVSFTAPRSLLNVCITVQNLVLNCRRPNIEAAMLATAFNLRYALITWPAILVVVLATLMAAFPGQIWWLLPIALLCLGSVALGFHDLHQTRHAVLRNYPVAAHLRFLLESIRPEMRQYFFEGDKDGAPFPRDKRAIVYQRAKRDLDKRPFGTQYDVYEEQYEWLHHSIAPKPTLANDAMRTLVGVHHPAPLFGQPPEHLGDELWCSVRQRDPRPEQGREDRAASSMTPAKAASRPITANMAAIWCGKSAPATSARGRRTAALTRRNSPIPPLTRRSRWSS